MHWAGHGNEINRRGAFRFSRGKRGGKILLNKPLKHSDEPANGRIDGQHGCAYVCARCAAIGQTCCGLGGPEGDTAGGGPGALGAPASRAVASSGNEAECFPVSHAERERILRAIGALPPERLRQCPGGRESLFKQHPNTPSFVDSLNALFPRQKARVAELYPAGGSHLRMNLTAEGNCALLAPDGCVLPQEARPWFCRVYPFWVMGRQLACFAPEDCLAVRENKTPGLLLRAFGTNKENVLQLYNNLRDDWGLGDIPK